MISKLFTVDSFFSRNFFSLNCMEFIVMTETPSTRGSSLWMLNFYTFAAREDWLLEGVFCQIDINSSVFWNVFRPECTVFSDLITPYVFLIVKW
jgi:hypothetical protein